MEDTGMGYSLVTSFPRKVHRMRPTRASGPRVILSFFVLQNCAIRALTIPYGIIPTSRTFNTNQRSWGGGGGWLIMVACAGDSHYRAASLILWGHAWLAPKSASLIRGRRTKVKTWLMAPKGADTNFIILPVFWGWRSDRHMFMSPEYRIWLVSSFLRISLKKNRKWISSWNIHTFLTIFD